MTTSRVFYLLVNGKPHGPFPAEKLRQQMASGVLRPGTQVSNDGFTWRPVETIMSELGAPPSPPGLPVAPLRAPPAPVNAAPARFPVVTPSHSVRFSGVPSDVPPPLPQNDSHRAALLAVGLLCLVLVTTLAGLIAFRPWNQQADPGPPDGGQSVAVAPANPGNPVPEAPIAVVPELDPLPQPKPPDRMTAQMLVAKCAPSVAMVEFENGHGSGFLVDSDLLATNAHVVGNRDNAMVRILFPSAEPKDKGPLNGRVVFLDKDRDLALVRVKSDLPFLKLGNSDLLNKGEDIVVIGSPGLGRGGGVLVNAISKGVYSTTVGQKGEGAYLHMSLAVNPGNSGGPAFNDRGEVVGVVTAKGIRVEGVALCVPANDLKAAIEREK